MSCCRFWTSGPRGGRSRCSGRQAGGRRGVRAAGPGLPVRREAHFRLHGGMGDWVSRWVGVLGGKGRCGPVPIASQPACLPARVHQCSGGSTAPRPATSGWWQRRIPTSAHMVPGMWGLSAWAGAAAWRLRTACMQWATHAAETMCENLFWGRRPGTGVRSLPTHACLQALRRRRCRCGLQAGGCGCFGGGGGRAGQRCRINAVQRPD